MNKGLHGLHFCSRPHVPRLLVEHMALQDKHFCTSLLVPTPLGNQHGGLSGLRF